MKGIFRVFVFLLILFTIIAPRVRAQDYLSEIVTALRKSPVYVAPGTEGTTSDTAGKLLARFTQDDFIVLVMLPASAEKEIGTDVYTFATRIYDGLGDGRTVGLSVGRKVVGYSPRLPAGVASDLMVRADNVSNDPVTAIGTYLQNVRRWVKENPQPKPLPTPTPTPTPVPESSQGDSDLSWVWWVVFALIVIAFCCMYLIINIGKPSDTKVIFNVPDVIKGLLSSVTRDSEEVSESELRQKLIQLCKDIERYFQKSCSDVRKDSYFFKDRLTEAVRVLTKYRDAQDNPRYYNDPEKVMEQGKKALLDFCDYVLQSIRDGNEKDLTAFKVDTRILGIHRLIRSGVAIDVALDNIKKKKSN